MNTCCIHRLTSGLTATSKSDNENDTSTNAKLLTKAGFVHRIGSGVYTLMPLGLRVLNRIEQIVRQEMNGLGASEFLSPILYPREIWESSGRWESIDVLYKVNSRSGAEFCLSATAEEVVVHAAKRFIRSYRDLPYASYQIQSKCRDELRARSGLLRGREFRMKDLYSFHLDKDQLNEYYEEVCCAYMRIFNRCGIGSRVLRTFASGGAFSRFSDEFQLVCDSGEDRIFVSKDRSVAINAEVAGDTQALQEVFDGKAVELEECRAIEVGNTFKLGSRFTDSGQLFVQDATGAQRSVLMCSYGIGTTRLVGSIAELCHDDQGLTWPSEVAPYDVHIVCLSEADAIRERVEEVARALRDAELDVLIDDRSGVRAGEKFSDADLIGIPYRVTFGTRSEEGKIEVTQRRTREVISVDNAGLSTYLRDNRGR